MLRIYLHDTPYNTTSALRTESTNGRSKRLNPAEAPKSIFILFPSGAPYIYVSLSSSGAVLTDPESKSLQKFIVEAIPKALSQPSQRYELRSTGLTARSLTALLAHRGAERSSAAAGGWSIFVTDSKGRNALDFSNADGKDLEKHDEEDAEADKENAPAPQGGKKRPFEHVNPISNADEKTRKRLKLLAKSRFGDYGISDDGKNLHSFSVRVQDSFDRRSTIRKPATASRKGNGKEANPFVHQGEVNRDDEELDGFKPDIKLNFQGSHVFAGLRMLVGKGVIGGKRMPGWLTGEAGVSIGIVKEGRIDSATT